MKILKKNSAFSFILVLAFIWVALSLWPKPNTPEPTATKLTIPKPSSQLDFESIKANILKDYQGKILTISKLDSSTAWVKLDDSYYNSVEKIAKAAQSIGIYLRNSTGGELTPSVHVFIGNTHTAISRSPYSKAIIKIEEWN